MGIKFRQSINNLQTYNVGGRSDLSSDWECFDWNESEFPPTNKVFEVMKSFYRYERYPDITAKLLKSKLSEYVSLPVDFIEIYNGSDDALKDIITVFVDKETHVLSYQPSYTQVNTFITTNTENYMKVNIKNPLGEHEYDFDYCKVANVVYLVNPNNPTGKLLEVDEIEKLLKTYPDTLFIVDEAYYEFAKQSCSHLVISHKNLIVTRTFSKAFGLASVRLGYCMGHPDTLSHLRKIRNGKAVNSLAQLCGVAALDDLDYLDSRIDEMNDAKKFFVDNLPHGYYAVDSQTNFVLLKTPDSKELLNKMKNNKILIRDRSSFDNLENCVRITIGSKKQIIRVLDVINA
jgi:histidinol-phosphate aminotransferase